MNRSTIIVIGLVACSLIAGLGYLASCSTKVESPLTGLPVNLEQAYQDLDAKHELDKAQTQREAAAAEAEAAGLRQREQADLAKANAERNRRTAKERRDHDRFVATVTTEAQAKVREASDKLADSQALSDAELEAAVASISLGVQTQIDAKAADVEAKARERLEAIQRQQAAIDAAAKADAEKWALINGIWEAAQPVLGAVPGGAALGGGVNAVLAILAGGGGLTALRARGKQKDVEALQARTAARAKQLSAAAVSIVDSVDAVKDALKGKVDPSLLEEIKKIMREWQSPDAIELVNVAQTHGDPLARLIAKEVSSAATLKEAA